MIGSFSGGDVREFGKKEEEEREIQLGWLGSLGMTSLLHLRPKGALSHILALCSE